jgi:DNA-binding winged helix-turn-helix (wHTH) protein
MEIADMDVAVKQPAANAVMQETIAARVEAIRQAHANNLIENMDMGADVLQAMLQRAREPISNEEFTRREEALWLKRHQVHGARASAA